MNDREAVGTLILKLIHEWNAEGRDFVDGLPEPSLLALRNGLARAAIACLRERWTSDGAVSRATRAARHEYDPRFGGQSRINVMDIMSAAMRDSE